MAQLRTGSVSSWTSHSCQ